jgi:hypothetical protein
MGRAKGKTVASVLIIDDQQEGGSLATYLRQSRSIATKVLHPEDVEPADIADADLVLVDYHLGLWPARDQAPVSRAPIDGLALAAVLRRHVHDNERASPTAFAILTAEIGRLAEPLPPEHREHVLARVTNLEWVFRKASAQGETDLAGQIASMATAVKSLPKQWPQSSAEDSLHQLAKILDFDPDDSKCSQQLQDVSACVPPIHELSEWSHGLAVIRWLLHRILPYPCFLWDSHYLAARLRVDHGWLRTELSRNGSLRKWLEPARYTGLLSGFLGDRWWRSCIESLLWERTKHRSFDVQQILKTLRSGTRKVVKPSEPADHPIVCVNSAYRPIDTFAALEAAIRIRPDDWPPFADQPWTTIELA